MSGVDTTQADPRAGAVQEGPPADAAELLARVRARAADPLPDDPASTAPTHRWWYGPGEYESAVLDRLVREGRAAARHVHYSDNYARPTGRALFARSLGSDERDLRLSATGRVSVRVDGIEVPVDQVDGVWRVVVEHGERVEVDVLAADGVPAAIGEESYGGGWEGRDGSGASLALIERPGGERAPHELGEPTTPVTLREAEAGLWIAPAPVLGTVELLSDEPQPGRRPALTVGESIAEAEATDGIEESVTDLVHDDRGGWRSRRPVAVAALRIRGPRVRSARVHASVRPAPRRGGFLCDDETLNRVWAVSTYTLRLCMQSLLVDGIKRDRMPWIGDQALAIASNAYGFGDGGIARDGLVALGRLRHGYVNGISDYSLWWVIAQAAYLEHFGDEAHLAREAGAIAVAVERLAEHAGDDGVFRPAVQRDGFIDAGAGSVFLDWGVELEPGRDSTAVQALWHWALRSAATVLGRAGHPSASRWQVLADRTGDTLRTHGWHDATERWRTYLDGKEIDSPYPAFLAVLAGLHPPEHPGATRDLLSAGTRGTPFMLAFALRARAALGDRVDAVRVVRERWGAMLDAGSGTFWEEFPREGASPYELYGRPFGKSLCHGWSTGPTALLPELVLGVRPVKAGWREFVVDPELGELGWAAATVPTPHGAVFVVARPDAVEVGVPEGSALVRGAERWEGPCSVSW